MVDSAFFFKVLNVPLNNSLTLSNQFDAKIEWLSSRLWCLMEYKNSKYNLAS